MDPNLESPIGKQIALDELTFQEPPVKERLARIEREVSLIATPAWHHLPWYVRGATGGTPETRYFFSTQWCDHSPDKRTCNCNFGTYPCHSFQLNATPRDLRVDEPKAIHSWSLYARRHPAKEGWGADVDYTENWNQGRLIQTHFKVRLYRERWSVGASSRPTLELPCDHLALQRKFGAAEYFFQAKLPHSNHAFVPEYLASPEQLRATALANLESLEQLLEVQITSDSPVLVRDHSKLVSSPPTSNPPEWGPPLPTEFAPPIPDNYALTEEQKQELLAQLAEETKRKRQLIEEASAEIHTAIEETFPLGKVLAELDQPEASPGQ